MAEWVDRLAELIQQIQTVRLEKLMAYVKNDDMADLVAQFEDGKTDRDIILVSGVDNFDMFTERMQEEYNTFVMPPLSSSKEMKHHLYYNDTIDKEWKGIIIIDIPATVQTMLEMSFFLLHIKDIQRGRLYGPNYRDKRIINPPQICCFTGKVSPWAMKHKPESGTISFQTDIGTV